MQRFAYHHGIAPNLFILLALAVGETIVVHVVVLALWGWTVAIPLGLLDLSAVCLLLGLLRSLRRHPVTIAEGVLTMRLGWLKSVVVPLDQISGLRESWDAAALKEPGVVNLALATWPNVVIDIDPPIARRRGLIAAVAHKFDDPTAFASALRGCMGSE